jgi:diaminohydroxyphosphoribosylaminopyrimidine deaminase/5-amino-6-(5-phosphoribosylamino)uracil reductase
MGNRVIPNTHNLNDGTAPTFFLQSHKISDLLDLLEKLEVNQVLVESGATLGTFLVKSDVVDEIHIYLNPSLLGTGQNFIGDLGINSLENRINFKIYSSEIVDTDLKIILVKDQ